jgi:hypothetical protein
MEVMEVMWVMEVMPASGRGGDEPLCSGSRGEGGG